MEAPVTPPTPVTVFFSDDHPDTQESGYEVAIAYAEDGSIESVAIADHQMMDMVEVPAEIALLIAKAINDNVRPSTTRLN